MTNITKLWFVVFAVDSDSVDLPNMSEVLILDRMSSKKAKIGDPVDANHCVTDVEVCCHV